MKIISGIKHNLSDTAVMSGRVLRHTFRSIDTLITVVAMPIMMMLMFVYVLGGAMNTGSVDYINFVVPGIVLLTIASGVAYTAFRSGDLRPFLTVLVLLVAFLAGFRPEAGITGWLLAIGIILMFTLAMTWAPVTFGLLANSGEGAAVFFYPLLGLLFISSAFAPTETMPGAVRIFAEHQPMTPIIEAVRGLMMNEPVSNNALIAVIWCLSILIVFYIAAMQIYKRKTA